MKNRSEVRCGQRVQAKEIAAQRPRDGVTAGVFQERGGQGERQLELSEQQGRENVKMKSLD